MTYIRLLLGNIVMLNVYEKIKPMNYSFKSFPKFCLILVVVFFASHTSMAQNRDKTSIEQVIDNYIVGWRTANADLLKKAFDLEAGVILWVDKNEASEQLKSMKLSELISNIKLHDTYGIGYTIKDLEIVDSQIAIALVKIPTKKSYYIDCLELQKINGSWKIVLKSFVYFPKR